MDICLKDFPERCLFVQKLPKTLVSVSQIICVTGKRTFFPLVFEVGEFKLLSENFSQIIGTGLHLMRGIPSLPGAGPASVLLTNRLLAYDLALFALS